MNPTTRSVLPAALAAWLVCSLLPADELLRTPYDQQIAENVDKLASDTPKIRAAAAESLGFLRAYAAERSVIAATKDPALVVRRQATLALAWCGGREAIGPLLGSLDDDDWVTRQSAHVALTNLTGMEFPFDAVGPLETRRKQAGRWRQWWASVPADRAPEEVVKLLSGTKGWLGSGRFTTSSTYMGPPDVLLDGRIGPAYWQTKNVPLPQWITLDLEKPQEVGRVVIHQHSAAFVMTDYEVATSIDGKKFDVVQRKEGRTPVKLVVQFPSRTARYIRITSHGSANPTYPCTFFEIEVGGYRPKHMRKIESQEWRLERGVRALGILGGPGASETIVAALGENPPVAVQYRPMVRAGIRSLGRLRQEAGFEALVGYLDNTMWARCAAEALGDFRDRRAVARLLEVYPKYAKLLNGNNPKAVPRDDVMGFPSEDRMLDTAYCIEFALCRLPLDNPADRAVLRSLAPLVMANLQGDHDTFFLYEPEPGHLVTHWLLQLAGLRQEACEQAMIILGQPRRVPMPADTAEMKWPPFTGYRIASWLPAVCTEKEDLPRLLALMAHDDGWVRLNAAKTIAWQGDPRAIEPLAVLLREAKSEGDYGYNGTFKNEEFDDPAPRWREGLVRALGLLGAHEHTAMIAGVLNDQGSVLGVRHAAAQALGDLGNDEALAALRVAAMEHDFLSIRHIARDALRARGIELPPEPLQPTHASAATADATPAHAASQTPEAIVFIKGDNSIPNTIGTVEQADRWRATYVVTDSGPAYRPGRNLYVLRPPRPDGTVTPLTEFPDGYVAEHELSWDAGHVIFCRRGQEDPWWHVWRINLDGSGLEPLTHGPYHDVGPVYLPDGRIVFTTTRGGIRDEYHGYPCTALWVMNADGSDLHPIATNIGRDNEPAILADGRIVFSRLEVFYSRNKTELTLHAIHPDGTKDVVLYGPERRQFWRSLDHGPRTPADGQEAPLTHRVLRMTQPQPMPDGRSIVVVTQGGLVLVGQRRDTETFITPDNKTRSYTTPFPLPDGRILCASTLKESDRKKVDLGLYTFDPESQELELLYNDPSSADFEPRPVLARRPPMQQATDTRRGAYSGRFVCTSVFSTQEEDVPMRGKLVRLIEGVPAVTRHSTHTNPEPVWKNHGGTFARVLGTAPLASDGSFHVEAPADRLMHFQVLDSDRRVIGNQRTWIYARGNELKSCVGCHENPHTTSRGNDPLATHYPPMDFRPDGTEFTYRAKAWFKGHLPGEIEERTRTTRAVNLMAR